METAEVLPVECRSESREHLADFREILAQTEIVVTTQTPSGFGEELDEGLGQKIRKAVSELFLTLPSSATPVYL